MVTPAGFEPATCPLGGGCSIQLSHGAMLAACNIAFLRCCHHRVIALRIKCLAAGICGANMVALNFRQKVLPCPLICLQKRIAP